MKNTVFIKSILYVLVPIIILSGCGISENQYNEKIKKAEEALNADSTKVPEKEEVLKLVDLYSDFAEKFPDSEISPEYLFRAGRYCMSYNLATKALEFFDKIIEHYPEYPKHPDSYFLKAFVYDSQLNNIPLARKSYEDLIEKYPDNELAEQAKELINLLGKSLEDIVSEFEKNNNNNQNNAIVEE